MDNRENEVVLAAFDVACCSAESGVTAGMVYLRCKGAEEAGIIR